MFSQLRTQGRKLQIIECQFQFPVQVSEQGLERIRLQADQSIADLQGLRRSLFEVVDECLHVAIASSQLPQPLVCTCQVFQSCRNESPVDGVTAAGCVLQVFLGLLQVYYRLFQGLLLDLDDSLIVKVLDPSHKLRRVGNHFMDLCIAQCYSPTNILGGLVVGNIASFLTIQLHTLFKLCHIVITKVLCGW